MGRAAITLLGAATLIGVTACSGTSAESRPTPAPTSLSSFTPPTTSQPTSPAPARLAGPLWVGSGSRASDDNAGTHAQPFATIQHAVDLAADGAVVRVMRGTYPSFVVTHPVTVRGTSRTGVVVTSPTAPNLIEVAAPDTTITSLTVAGCVPDPNPPGGIDDHPNAGIRVDDGADGARITHVVVRDGVQPGGATYRIGCHGIFLHDADRVTVAHSRLVNNGTGIYVVGGGQHDRLVRNTIADNTALIRNTPTNVNANDDFGAVGIGFVDTTTSPGPLAAHNRIRHNRGPSYDYGTDGGGFEIFQASHVTMRDNVLVDNDEILETGTSSPSLTCSDNVFTHNATVGTSSTATESLSKGMILRCAKDMRITHNHIDDADYWAFVIGGTDSFSSSIRGLRITGNVVDQTYDQMFASTVDPRTWGATIDHNTYHWQCDGTYSFATLPAGRARSLSQWQAATPYDADSTSAMLAC